MTRPPYGSGSGQGDDDDLAAKTPFFTELEKLLSWSGGPVNWDLARQVALRTAGAGAPQAGPAEEAAAAEALRLADLWLDEVTALPSTGSTPHAWTRIRWIEQTLPVWRTVCDPVAARVADALGGAMTSGLADLGQSPLIPEELRSALPAEMLSAGGLQGAMGPLLGMMGQLGGLMFGAQVGQALGGLATEVLSATDVGLPLAPSGVVALVPANVAAFSAGLGVPDDQVRLAVALREVARERLFAKVHWLRGHLLGAIEDYARGITVDKDVIGRALQEINPTDPESIQRALGGGLFEQEPSPAQQAALGRLGTLLALVEGWVDETVGAAAGTRLPSAAALRETIQRRRATGGPAEQTFATLVGLELRPRRLREAAALWRHLTEVRGVDGRDGLWEHPDLLPHEDDLEHPETFAEGRTSGVPDDPIAAIERLREQEPPADGADPPAGS